MSINRVSPNLVGVLKVGETTVLVDGVQWDQLLGLKKWWKLRGRVADNAQRRRCGQ